MSTLNKKCLQDMGITYKFVTRLKRTAGIAQW